MHLPLLAELVAIVGGTVLSMEPAPDGGSTIEAQVATILIQDGRIQAVGPELELPPGTVQIDATGRFVMPGLVDGFVQFDGDHDALYTAAGVTLVRDVGGDRARLLSMRANRGRVPGPALLTAGAVIGGEPPASPEAAVFRTAAEAERLAPLLFADQVDFFSLYPNLPADAWARSIELAHANGIPVWGPVGGEMGFAACVAAGQDGFFYLDSLLPSGVEWDFVQPPAFKKNIAALVEAEAGLVPMLRATAMRLDPDLEPDVEQERYFRFLSPHYAGFWIAEKRFRMRIAAENEGFLENGQRVVAKQAKVLALLDEAGAKLIPGSGASHPWLMPGFGLNEELELWQAAGLTPERILRAATVDAAAALGQRTNRGRIAPGLIADLIVLAEDPRLDVANLRAPEVVVVRGDVLAAEDLTDITSVLLASMAERQQAEIAPLEIPEPDHPEGEVVLEGNLETRSRGIRVSGERWCVVRTLEGTTAFCGRVLTPPDESFQGSNLNVIQHVRDGELVRFDLTLTQGANVLTLRGEFAAERWTLERRLDGGFLDSRRTPERVATVSVGSVTTAMVLGFCERSGRMPVINLHEAFEAEVVAWEVEIADQGRHLVRTSTGGMGFQFGPKGGIEIWRSQVGEAASEALVISEQSFGGPGLAMPVKAPTVRPGPVPAGGL